MVTFDVRASLYRFGLLRRQRQAGVLRDPRQRLVDVDVRPGGIFRRQLGEPLSDVPLGAMQFGEERARRVGHGVGDEGAVGQLDGLFAGRGGNPAPRSSTCAAGVEKRCTCAATAREDAPAGDDFPGSVDLHRAPQARL